MALISDYAVLRQEQVGLLRPIAHLLRERILAPLPRRPIPA